MLAGYVLLALGLLFARRHVALACCTILMGQVPWVARAIKNKKWSPTGVFPSIQLAERTQWTVPHVGGSATADTLRSRLALRGHSSRPQHACFRRML